MYYRRLCRTLNDKGILIPSDTNIWDYVKDCNVDWYQSVYLYNDEQFNTFKKTGSVAGIEDVVSNKIWWDFDKENDLESSRNDAVELCNRLCESFVSNPKNLLITFSGKKGFGVEVLLTEYYSNKEILTAATRLAEGLNTFDTRVYNSNRVLRLPYTKHQETGFYKVPITINELNDLKINEIILLSKSFPELELNLEAEKLPKHLTIKTEVKSPKVNTELNGLNFNDKPKFLSACRWALQNGFFKEGERSSSLLCLASTYKNLGFDLEHVYRLLKGTAELQAKRSNSDRYPDEEIYNNIVMQVFGPNWKNGQFTCREEDTWLYNYCQSLGNNKCNHRLEDDEKPKGLVDIHSSFKEYVANIDKNTIITGIPSIDERVFISTGANVGLIGAAGSGKSSVALNILNNTSKAGVKSVFASLDMHRNRMFEKVLYKISGLHREELYDIFRNNKEAKLMENLKEEFGNVFFFNRSCPSVQDVKNYVLACQDACGEKIKFVMLDYFERVTSEMSDDTASSKKVAGELQDLVNDLDIALITLVQPNKHALSGGVDQPIYDYTKIKGSSYVYQAFRIIMSLWRPFYNPKSFKDDKYMQMAILKNDLGELDEFAFKWNGPKGEIYEFETEEERYEFEQMLKAKENVQEDKSGYVGY